jgi:carbonic anhydrase
VKVIFMPGELERLMEGNKRFVEGKMSGKNLVARRSELVAGQKPFAIVLTCSDSRIVPEYIFDVTLGDIFVVRTAGNIADAIAIGSIEYAAEHLNAPLLVVLGHEKCGAIAATCAGGHAEGNIASIVAEIAPAASAQKNDAAKTVYENVRCVMKKIREKSKTVAHLEHEGKLRIVGAFYSMTTGKVEAL